MLSCYSLKNPQISQKHLKLYISEKKLVQRGELFRVDNSKAMLKNVIMP